jgi:two-component system KDP operon response regulator KdpE
MSHPTPVAVVIEDEPQIRRFVRAALEAEGWQVFEADTAQRGLTEAGTRKPDLLVLDLGLPDGDGLDVIRDVRGWSAVPIVVLSARVDEADKIAALDAGADDYLTKPFGVGELLARVRANLRRPRAAGADGAPEEPLFSFGDVVVHRQARLVRRAGVEVHLTPIEYRLLTV